MKLRYLFLTFLLLFPSIMALEFDFENTTSYEIEALASTEAIEDIEVHYSEALGSFVVGYRTNETNANGGDRFYLGKFDINWNEENDFSKLVHVNDGSQNVDSEDCSFILDYPETRNITVTCSQTYIEQGVNDRRYDQRFKLDGSLTNYEIGTNDNYCFGSMPCDRPAGTTTAHYTEVTMTSNGNSFLKRTNPSAEKVCYWHDNTDQECDASSPGECPSQADMDGTLLSYPSTLTASSYSYEMIYIGNVTKTVLGTNYVFPYYYLFWLDPADSDNVYYAKYRYEVNYGASAYYRQLETGNINTGATYSIRDISLAKNEDIILLTVLKNDGSDELFKIYTIYIDYDGKLSENIVSTYTSDTNPSFPFTAYDNDTIHSLGFANLGRGNLDIYSLLVNVQFDNGTNSIYSVPTNYTCDCSGWVSGDCIAGKRKQTRTCYPPDCSEEVQFISDSICESIKLGNMTITGSDCNNDNLDIEVIEEGQRSLRFSTNITVPDDCDNPEVESLTRAVWYNDYTIRKGLFGYRSCRNTGNVTVEACSPEGNCTTKTIECQNFTSLSVVHEQNSLWYSGQDVVSYHFAKFDKDCECIAGLFVEGCSEYSCQKICKDLVYCSGDELMTLGEDCSIVSSVTCSHGCLINRITGEGYCKEAPPPPTTTEEVGDWLDSLVNTDLRKLLPSPAIRFIAFSILGIFLAAVFIGMTESKSWEIGIFGFLVSYFIGVALNMISPIFLVILGLVGAYMIYNKLK